MKFKGTINLETERLILRKIEPNDYKIAFETWATDPELVVYTVHGVHEKEEETKKLFDRWIEEYNDIKTMRWVIALKENNMPIGIIDVQNQWARFSSVSTGYTIARKHWNKGYATEAVKKVMKFLFEECEIETFYAEFMEDNIGSGIVMKKCGMKQDGVLRNLCEDRNGKRQNLVSMSITKDEYYSLNR